MEMSAGKSEPPINLACNRPCGPAGGSGSIQSKTPDTFDFPARGTPDTSFLYPLDDGNNETIQAYPYQILDDNRREDVTKTLVFLHGYNVDEQSAVATFDELYKRVWWQGFRGNFIGFTWEGNEYNVPLTNLTFFKPNVTNAFQTAPTLWMFLRNTVQEEWQIDPSDIDVMAHSLGNQVMWDAMRINAWKTSEDLFNNAISVQAAIWQEAFDAYGDKSYVAPSDPITYSADELKRMSWRSWFNQPGRNPKSALTGQVFHSYKDDDTALVYWMRLSNHAINGPGGLGGLNYNRSAGAPYRRIMGTGGGVGGMASLPALMQDEHRTANQADGKYYYNYDQLNVPIGAVENPLADVNFNAGTTEWENGKHSDFKDLKYIQIYDWYKRFLIDTDAIAIGAQ